ncbi:MAG: AzlD domain-containing protein [Actinobacteria bacterium]|nr:AzlD domain-containing protein [Actinomycetota bacterium]
MSDLVLILVLAVTTYLLRVGFIGLLHSRAMKPRSQRIVEQIRPAAFAALAVTAMVQFPGFGPPYLIAAIVVAIGARLRWDLLLNLVLGMAVVGILTNLP